MMGFAEQLLVLLRQAGANGRTSVELANLLYGESSYAAIGRARESIARLRRKGHAILLTGQKGQSGQRERKHKGASK
jgi:hypothetical protein